MRVIAGSAKGRRLRAPKGERTRPTSDFVREAIFNTVAGLVDLDEAVVVDLFAGSGAMGIEALSRGAARAVFVERHRDALVTIRANLSSVGFEARAEVLEGDVLGSLRRIPPADVVFADPPYAFADWDLLFAGVDAALVVAESDREIVPPEPWRVLKSKRYGSTVVTITSPRSNV